MVDPETIYHWYRLDDRITTSGQPTETELADIAALGVRCVIISGYIVMRRRSETRRRLCTPSA
jgi:hypothetical protein